MYSVELVNQILAPNPKILDRSTHSENLLVWGNGQFTFTDFSDHVAFSDKHYPHEENHGGYMTPKQMLEYYIQMVKEVPGYSVSRDQQQFYSFVMGAFRTRGVNIKLEGSDDQKMAAQRIWEGGMAYQVFKARRDGKYVAEGALDEFREKSTNSFGRKDLAMNSADTFAERLNRAKQEMQTILGQIRPKISDTAILAGMEGLSISLGQSNLLASLEQVDNVWQGFFKGGYENLTEQEKGSLRSAMSYFGSFDYAVVNPLQKYFEHEMDVIKGAKVSAPEQDRESLDSAEQELKEKIQQFVDQVNGDPRQLYYFINNPDEVRKLVTFNFYGN